MACPHLVDVSLPSLSKRLHADSFQRKLQCKTLSCASRCKVPFSSLWICLSCSYVGCGRNDNQHALHHSTQSSKHPLFFNPHTCMIWCYACDAEVHDGNDADLLDQSAVDPRRVRNLFQEAAKPNAKHLHDGAVAGTVAGTVATRSRQPSLKGLTGLQNLGNTCYLNSALQCLSNCPPLQRYFRTCHTLFLRPLDVTDNKVSVTYRLAHHLHELLVSMWSGGHSYIAPQNVVRAVFDLNPTFRGYGQQDSQEFLRCLLDNLHEELRQEVPATYADFCNLHTSSLHNADAMQTDKGDSYKTVFRSIISETFEGLLRSEVKCLACGKTSVTDDRYYDLSVSIPRKRDRAKVTATKDKAVANGQTVDDNLADDRKEKSWGWFSGIGKLFGFGGGSTGLYDCLYNFCSTEELTGSDRYQCEFCKTRNDCHKTFSILRLPEVLCIHIKRFRYDSYFGQKISSTVTFPMEDLEMRPFVHPQCPSAELTQYELIGLIRHIGGLGGGHYIAYCKNYKSNRWFEFDDSHVTEVSERDVLGQEAYVLWYRRKPAHPPPPPPPAAQPPPGEGLNGPAVDLQTERRQLKRRIQNFLPRLPNEPAFYLSKAWLNRFLTVAAPGPISNYELLCEHGVPVGSNSETKLVALPADVWAQLVDKFGGGPAVQILSDCQACAKFNQQRNLRRNVEKNLIQKYDSLTTEPGKHWYLVESGWLRDWKNFLWDSGSVSIRGKERWVPPGPINNHKLLDKDGVTPKLGLKKAHHYRGVNVRVWKLFYRIYGGGPLVCRPQLDLYSESIPDAEPINLDSEDEERIQRLLSGLLVESDVNLG